MIEAEDGEPEPIVFADTSFVYPWLFERHPLHLEAKQLEAALGETRVFTIDGVVTELLANMSKQRLRPTAIEFVDEMMRPGGRYRVIEQTRADLLAGLERYRAQGSGSPSLVDCMLMNEMDRMGIAAVLAFDRDFHHAGLYRVHPRRG